MPGKKPDRRDLPPGKFGDEDHEKAMVVWRKSYTDQGLPVPGEGPKLPGGPAEEGSSPSSPSGAPRRAKEPPMDVSGSAPMKPSLGEVAANQGSATVGYETFTNEKGRSEIRKTGTEKDKVAVAHGQEETQEKIAETTGAEKLEFPEPEPQTPPKDAPLPDQTAYSKKKRDWVRRREAWAATNKPKQTLFPK